MLKFNKVAVLDTKCFCKINTQMSINFLNFNYIGNDVQTTMFSYMFACNHHCKIYSYR